MQSILNRLVEKINAAPLQTEPDLNIYVEEVFDPAVYSEILARLPSTEAYEFIKHPDATLPDGTITRKLLSLSTKSIQKTAKEDQSFWTMINEVLTSNELQNALVQKFKERITQIYGEPLPAMGNIPIFYRDFPGYKIGIHTDAPFKIATMQFYLPKDNSQTHLGTSFHQKKDGDFRLLKTNLFKTNSAYAFVRSEQSWHSVREIAANENQRNTLALTIYLKDHEEYQRVIDIDGPKEYQ